LAGTVGRSMEPMGGFPMLKRSQILLAACVATLPLLAIGRAGTATEGVPTTRREHSATVLTTGQSFTRGYTGRVYGAGEAVGDAVGSHRPLAAASA